MLPESGKFVGKWEVVDIGLSQNKLEELQSSFYTIDRDLARIILKPRSKFSHKGTYGKALLVVGSYGKMGAGILAVRAALRSGLGLLTCHIPECGYSIMQTAVPEAMCLIDQDKYHITEAIENTGYDSIGIGPGIGTESETERALTKMLESAECPMVIDADALNIISENRELLHLIPKGSILTPHIKEFERLAGYTANDFERLELQQSFSKKYEIVIVLKGAHSSVSLPNGTVYFNTTGNPGMATAGSGDVLTGILTGLLAQGYTYEDTARLGVYIHGLAGNLAKAKVGEEALVAGDIVENLGEAFRTIRYGQ